MRFRPMLACPATLEDLVFPCVGFFKYDGFRALLTGKGLLSRKLKPIPNLAVRAWLQSSGLMHLDGELIHGEHDKDVFNRTSSIITTRDAPRDGVRYIIFDWFGDPAQPPYRSRWAHLKLLRLPPGVETAHTQMLHDLRQAREFEALAISMKFEGIVTRALDGPYKMGRSTMTQQWMMKVKRFEDTECRILKVLPRTKNANARKTNALGYSERSKKKAGLVPISEVGKFVVRELKTGVVFKCAPGILTQAQRRELWRARARLPGKIARVRVQREGAQKKPRFGRFYGLRSRIDF